jgi:flagellar biosynthetic protein FliR
MIFLFASCRVAGMIFFNPIFGRKGIPSAIKVGLSVLVALFAVYDIGNVYVLDYSTIELVLIVGKEMIIGIAIGFVMHLFLSVFQIGGQLIDLQIGLSMAAMYDPASNSSISVTSNLISGMYILVFFISNCHLALINIVVKSFQVIPIGLQAISSRVGVYFIELFGCILVFAVQLAMPIIVTEIIVEFAVGILMRLVPNINVFVINLQMKILVGLVVILTIIPALVQFTAKMNAIMMEKISQLLTLFI